MKNSDEHIDRYIKEIDKVIDAYNNWLLSVVVILIFLMVALIFLFI